MAALSFSQMKTRGKVKLRDTTNVTLTDSEHTENLKSALYDPYVYIIDRDDNTTTVANQANYDVPDGMTEVTDIMIDLYDNGYPVRVERQGYDVINGVIYFDLRHQSIPDGKTMIIIGKAKLDENSLIPDFLQEYVFQLYMIETFEMIKTSLTTRFVKNDITMSEIIASINTHKSRAAELRSQLSNHRNVID